MEQSVLEAQVQGQVVELPVGKITPNPHQPRQRFDEEALQELGASIREKGVFQPVVVRLLNATEGTYELVVGERRLRACKLIEKETIPAIIRDISPEESRELALIENLQRDDLTIMEEARSLLGLFEQYAVMQTVADKIGKSITYVTRRLALLELPLEIQTMLDDGQILATHADVILEVEGQENQLNAARWAAKLNLSAAQLHGRMLKHMKPKPENGGSRGGVVKFGYVSGGVARLYDAVVYFNYAMLRDPNKRQTLKQQMTLLYSAIENALAKLDEPVEDTGELSEDGASEE